MNSRTPFAVGPLLDQLHLKGISVRVCGTNLHVRPVEKLTREVLGTLREHKIEIMRAIRRRSLTEAEGRAWNERTAIATVDGTLRATAAEDLARKQVEQRRQAEPWTSVPPCRCRDCRRWRGSGGCLVGIVLPGEYPPDALHHCTDHVGDMHTRGEQART